MKYKCTPIMVDVATPVWEILPLFQLGQISIGSQKIESNRIGSKIHVNRGGCQMCAHQFWWVWPLQLRRYHYSQKQTNFPFNHGL